MTLTSNKSESGNRVPHHDQSQPLGRISGQILDRWQPGTGPQTCGSYTVLLYDNSTLSEDCNKLGWNGTQADGKWARANTMHQTRIQQAIRRIDGPQTEDFHFFQSYPRRRNCDDGSIDESTLTAVDSWAIIVRWVSDKKHIVIYPSII